LFQKNIALPDSLLSRFDLLFIVLDKMDPAHDRSIAEHVLRMHRYQTTETETSAAPVGGVVEDQGADIDPKNKTSQVYLKYNKMLHGLNSKRQICSIPFVKKYILYAKRKFSPVPTEEAVAKIVDAYDELRKREDTRTLPVTARTLETMIRLSVAHAKLRLSTEATEVRTIFCHKSNIVKRRGSA
jgi:DNA replication licensing factor MCM3